MEIGSLVLDIDKFNLGCFQIGLERNHRGHQVSQELGFLSREIRQNRFQLGDQISMKGDNGLLVILGGGGADADKRLRGFQVEIGTHQLG
jgi:hypothetical protein